MATNILNLRELEAFISKLNVDEIKNLLLKEEDLELEKIILGDDFHNFESEDAFFEEERIIDKKIIDLRNEINKFTVAAKGRDWRRVIAEDSDYIIISGVKIFTPQVLMNQHYGADESTSRYNLVGRNIYKINFDLFRVRNDDKPKLSFILFKSS